MDRFNRKLEELESQVHGLLEIPKPPQPYLQFIRKGMQKRVWFVKALLAAEKNSHHESVNHESIERASARLAVIEDTLAGWACSEPSLCFDSCLNGDDRGEEGGGDCSSSDTRTDSTVPQSEEGKVEKSEKGSLCRFFSKMALATGAVIAVAITRFSGMEELPFSVAT